MFVLRYKPDGTAGFAAFGLDFTFTNPTVLATNDGYAYVAGDLNLSGEVWDDLMFAGTNWGSDAFIAKLDSTGQFIWGRETALNGNGITGDMDRAQGKTIELDGDGNVYLFGSTRGSVAWGNGVVSGGPGITGRRLTVVAFDADGEPQWAINSNTANWFVTAQAFATGAEADAMHFAAHTTGEFTLGPFTTNSGGGQAAVFGRIGDLSTGVAEAPSLNGMHVWPNPASEQFQVEFTGAAPRRVELINSAGQRVGSTLLRPGRNTMDMSGLAPGLYLLRIEGREAVRVAVE
jgi:hypothetical protein